MNGKGSARRRGEDHKKLSDNWNGIKWGKDEEARNRRKELQRPVKYDSKPDK